MRRAEVACTLTHALCAPVCHGLKREIVRDPKLCTADQFGPCKRVNDSVMGLAQHSLIRLRTHSLAMERLIHRRATALPSQNCAG